MDPGQRMVFGTFSEHNQKDRRLDKAGDEAYLDDFVLRQVPRASRSRFDVVDDPKVEVWKPKEGMIFSSVSISGILDKRTSVLAIYGLALPAFNTPARIMTRRMHPTPLFGGIISTTMPFPSGHDISTGTGEASFRYSASTWVCSRYLRPATRRVPLPPVV
jgi:hypothetical protein